jgi:hypothetical protein
MGQKVKRKLFLHVRQYILSYEIAWLLIFFVTEYILHVSVYAIFSTSGNFPKPDRSNCSYETKFDM